MRRQFGSPDTGEEELLLDYGMHQRRLLPLLAKTYALHFTQEKLLAELHNVLSTTDAPDRQRRSLESLAAGTKAIGTWHASRTIQECREACGGAGYLMSNRLGALRADTDVFTTFEGDNHILLQLVAKGLLTDYSSSFGDLDQLGMVRFVAGLAVETVLERTSAHKLLERIKDVLPGGNDDTWDQDAGLLDPEYQLAMFRWREEHILSGVARRLKRGMDQGMDAVDVFSRVQDHVIAAGRAHVERLILEAFVDKLAVMVDSDNKVALSQLCDLYALSTIEADRGWFMEHGRLSSARSKAISREVSSLCRQLRPIAEDLVDGFGIPPEMLKAEMLDGPDVRARCLMLDRLRIPGLGGWGDDPLWGKFYDWTVEHPQAGGTLWKAGIGSDLRRLYSAAAEIGRQPAGSSVLDVPTGGGVALRGLRTGQGVRYVAADISQAMLDRTMRVARERHVVAQVEPVLADVGDLPFADGEFDLVVSFTGPALLPRPAPRRPRDGPGPAPRRGPDRQRAADRHRPALPAGAPGRPPRRPARPRRQQHRRPHLARRGRPRGGHPRAVRGDRVLPRAEGVGAAGFPGRPGKPSLDGRCNTRQVTELAVRSARFVRSPVAEEDAGGRRREPTSSVQRRSTSSQGPVPPKCVRRDSAHQPKESSCPPSPAPPPPRPSARTRSSRPWSPCSPPTSSAGWSPSRPG